MMVWLDSAYLWLPLEKGVCQQFNHLKQERQSYSYGNKVKDFRNTHCLHANKAANYEIPAPNSLE